MKRPRSACLVLIALVAIAACGGGPTITAKGLAAIMPSAADAPPGTTLQTDQSGPKTLDEFVAAEEVRAKLRSLGFKVGYVSTFTTRNFPADLTMAPYGTMLYGAFGVVFRDGEAAVSALAYYSTRARSRAKNPATVLSTALGKDSFAFRFSSLEDTPLPGIVYFWRVGNALFEVVGVGNPGPDGAAVRALGRLIDSRAMKS